MRKHNLYFTPILAILLLASCTKDPDEGIPAYIHIDEIKLSTNPAFQGTADHKIVDAWVFINDNNSGGYELPATIPILEKGTKNIKIWPGIKNNGMINWRIRFPHFTKYELDAELVPGEILTLEPAVTYLDDSEFWLEDFEDAGVKFQEITNSQGTMVTIDDPALVYEGQNSLHISLASNELEFQCEMIDKIELPQFGAKVYVELNYKSNNTFAIGLISNNIITEDRETVFQFNLTDTLNGEHIWNKTYIDFTEAVSSSTNAIDFGILFAVLKDPDNSETHTYLDNIKIVY